jgi:hypothetical protein
MANSKQKRATRRIPNSALTPIPPSVAAKRGAAVMKFDHNAASLALCHARAILLLVIDGSSSETEDTALSAALHFVEDAKAMIDGEDHRATEVSS